MARRAGKAAARTLGALAIVLSAVGANGLDLGLDQALEMAREVSYPLRRAELMRAQKEAALAEAEASRLPEFTLRATSTYLSNPQEGIGISPGDLGYLEDPGSTYPTPLPDTEVVLVPDPLNTYFQIQANMIWPLFSWGKLRGGARIAELDVQAASLDIDASDRSLVRDVSRAYYGVSVARRTEELLEQMRTVYSDIVSDRERAFDAGAVTLESVLEARSQLVSIESRSRTAAQTLRSAEASLAYLLGTEVDLTPVDPWRETLPELNTDLLTRKARENSTQRVQAAQASVLEDINRNSEPMRPDLALSVSLDASGQRIPLTPNWREEWDLGLTLTVVADAVAWDWGKRAAHTDASGAQAGIAEIGVEELSRSLRVQVVRLVEEAVSAAAQRDEKIAAQTLATEREKNAHVSFDNELITREQFRGAQVLSLTAQLEALGAGFAVESALLELEHLVGERIE